jgi:hypothetical protein
MFNLEEDWFLEGSNIWKMGYPTQDLLIGKYKIIKNSNLEKITRMVERRPILWK